MSDPLHVIRGRGKPMAFVVTALAVAMAVVANYGAFRLLDLNYFRWYLEDGPLIALLVTGVAVAVDLERVPNLISTHPAIFLGACFEVAGESFYSFQDLFQATPTRGGDAPTAGALDWIIALLFAIAFFALFFAWLIVIAPLQYFGNLVAGAPARLALAARVRTWVERRRNVVALTRGPIEEMPEGAEEIGLARHPVALTSSITAGLLFAISQFV